MNTTDRCQCGRAITDDSPSPDHCSDGCARNWAARVYQVPGMWPVPSSTPPPVPTPVPEGSAAARDAAAIRASAREAFVIRGRAYSFGDLMRRFGIPWGRS